MKKLFLSAFLVQILCHSIAAQEHIFPKSQQEDVEGIMAPGYWEYWNPEVQKQIDDNIERYRKADAVLSLPDAAKGTSVVVEQVSSSFQFGANIFNFNQLGCEEYNNIYKDTFVSLLNRATIPFYWMDFETEPGRMRFMEEWWDSEQWWNECRDPKQCSHWRKPATDMLLDWCHERGVHVHGHPLVWGSRKVYPRWLEVRIAGEQEAAKIDSAYAQRGKPHVSESDVLKPEYQALSPDSLATLFPNFAANVGKVYDEHVRTLMRHYGDKMDSWDVVNESAVDWAKGNLVEGDTLCKSHYGLMPGDYVYRAMDVASKEASPRVTLCINDYWTDKNYGDEIARLLERGTRIDCIGLQMHTFNPVTMQKIADGGNHRTPDKNWAKLEHLDKFDIPLHLSEITLPAPDSSLRSEKIQAIVTYNCYRQWFSVKNMVAITWWNLVDLQGSIIETLYSGIYGPDMHKKEVYYALDQLINHEWRTNFTTTLPKDKTLTFRGFRGTYKITYTTRSGQRKTIELTVE